jgi:hypothetical protein
MLQLWFWFTAAVSSLVSGLDIGVRIDPDGNH